MMSSPTRISAYVDLKVRDLFEKHTVEETRDVHKRVNVEIERKREELRMLVGERYRDLIDAADTIGTMRTSSSSIYDKLTSLRDKLSSLPTQLNSTKLQRVNAVNKWNPQDLEIAAELKLSLETSRQIQQRLEKMQIIEATHLSLYYSRKLSPKLSEYKCHFLSSLGDDESKDPSCSIESSIISSCYEAMQDFKVKPELLVECMVAKQILLKCPCESVFTDMLSNRVKLSKMDLVNNDELFVENIALTVHGVYCIFIDPQLYNGAVKQMRKPQMLMDGFGITFLPKSIEDFRNELIPVEEPPRVTRLVELILQFYIVPLQSILKSCYKDKVYLTEPTSLKEMENYRRITTELLKSKCEDLMRIVLGTTKTIWSEVFYPVFQEKCQDVAQISIQSIFNFLANEAFPRFQKLDQQFDLVTFLWKATAVTEKTSLNEDHLKLKCLSPHVADLCQEMEERFQVLQEDFLCLGDPSLKEFMSAKIVDAFQAFVTSKESGKTELFSGKFASAINNLCPTLWKFLDKNDANKLRQILNTLSEKCWTDWSDEILLKFSCDLENKIKNLSEENVTIIMPVGEEYVPEGEESFKPSIRVPLQISHGLHTQLFAICVELARIGPQSVPKSVRENFRKVIGLKIVSCYEKLLKSDQTSEESKQSEQIPPQVALQLIFDMKFVQWFHQKLSESVDPLAQQLQTVIDPFDLDIVNPRLKVNLKKFLFETHLTLGLLFSEESHSFIAQNFKTKQNQLFPISNPSLATPLPLLPV